MFEQPRLTFGYAGVKEREVYGETGVDVRDLGKQIVSF